MRVGVVIIAIVTLDFVNIHLRSHLEREKIPDSSTIGLKVVQCALKNRVNNKSTSVHFTKILFHIKNRKSLRQNSRRDFKVPTRHVMKAKCAR